VIVVGFALGCWAGWVFGYARGYRDRGVQHVADLQSNLAGVQSIIDGLKAKT
jgi:hypothetical protein